MLNLLFVIQLPIWLSKVSEFGNIKASLFCAVALSESVSNARKVAMPRPTQWLFTGAVLSLQLLRDISQGGAVHNARAASHQGDRHERQVRQLRANLIDQGARLP